MVAAVEVANHTGEIALIRDLSLTGALLFGRVDLPVGARVTLQLNIAADPTIARGVEGHVVRCRRRSPEGAGMWLFSIAVEFDRPATAFASEIEAVGKRARELHVGTAVE